MKYPLRGEYDTAVRNLDKFVLDSVLKLGKPIHQTQNPHLLRSYNGGKAIVYEIYTNPKKYALKCWIEDLGDLKIRYKAIDEYLKIIRLPYIVDFSYNEKGILVNGQKFPIVRMEWIDGISFKRFISNNIDNPICIRDFAEKFLEMVKTLHQNNISHGDLQHGNIMVRKNGDICLIDYDSLYVPQLSGERDNIKGLAGYQHPNRSKLLKLSSKSDYFSELVIYLSLLAISEKPSYWKSIEQEERLLFSEKDLAYPRLSSIFAELTKLSPEIVYFTLELEKFCRQSDVETLQPLESLVTAYGGSKTSWDFAPNVTPNLSPPATILVDLNSPDWSNFPANKAKSHNINLSGSDPWNKLDNISSAWDKLESSPATNDPWKKFDQPSQTQEMEPAIDENIWNKFDTIWNNLLQSISSIWSKFVSWFK
jgi:serine/threonine protein kinase